MKRNLHIKAMAGVFPGAESVEDFWENLLVARVAPAQRLDSYWGVQRESYTQAEADGHISMDLGHVAKSTSTESSLPRQIAAAVDIARSLKGDRDDGKCALIVATEWTDPSYYEVFSGLKKPSEGFSVERQLEVIARESGISGGSLAVDTACASALYAIELARGLLQTGQVDSVVVLGLNLHLHSFLYRGFTKLGAFSRRGSLRSFDKNADGIIPGEAACGILLELSSTGSIAEIDGVGLSSDGNEGSAFSPGFQGQLTAYARAFRDSELSPADLDYVEAHGTATVLGDQTELKSLNTFFKRDRRSPLVVGAVKSNVGHTLAAAGLVSIIKAALIISRRTIPPHIEVDPNSALGPGLSILKQPKKLTKEKVAVGVSAFGFGGSNAHVILKSPSADEVTVSASSMDLPGFAITSLNVQSPQDILKAPELLREIPMGPKMQARLDALQRRMLRSVQATIGGAPAPVQHPLSCVVLNNLGGSLSLEFDRKYRSTHPGPELTIEAIASTLPSMLSGYPSLVFNFRGQHMLVSGSNGALGILLSLCPYLLERSEGDLIIGVAHQNYLPGEHALEGLASFLISKRAADALAWIHCLPGRDLPAAAQRPMGEATGLDEFTAIVKGPPGVSELTIAGRCFRVEVGDASSGDRALREKVLRESETNKEFALQYLKLMAHLKTQTTIAPAVGSFLRNCERTAGMASAELVVDETHPYFFDHPLDHVPGILTIHACEELLQWYLEGKGRVTSLTVRFTKFLEKSEATLVALRETSANLFDFEIRQGDRRAGTLKITVEAESAPRIPGIIHSPCKLVNEKKFTHKHREENILVSELRSKSVEARDLTVAGNEFFQDLLQERISLLYFAEVSRQFIMLMAHLDKEIPTSAKMNLIGTEIWIDRWVTPPFELRLGSFELTQTETFLVADVMVEFLHRGKVFGGGKLKAQVVSEDYYLSQRSEA